VNLAADLEARPRRMKHWTPDEDQRLMSWWGAFTVETIAIRLDRSPKGVIDRAKALDLGAPSRGLWSMNALVAHLGYCDRAIKTAARRAGVSLVRRAITTTLGRDGHHAKRSTRFALDDDEVAAILTELLASPFDRVMASRRGEWGTGRKPAACRGCGTSDRPHFARGLCRRCYAVALAGRTIARYPVVRAKN
jgi:hypothetical protein